jgi:hypothetical protein
MFKNNVQGVGNGEQNTRNVASTFDEVLASIN